MAAARVKLRPRSCLAQESGVGVQKDLPKRCWGCVICCCPLSALGKRAKILAGPKVKVCAAHAVGQRDKAGRVGVDQKRKEVANGPKPPNGSMEKGRMAMPEEVSS